MPAPLSRDERIRRAAESIAAARAELQTLPDQGRERTYIIVRTRKHLGAASNVLRRLLPPAWQNKPRDVEAEALDEQIDKLWPDPNRVFNKKNEKWE